MLADVGGGPRLRVRLVTARIHPHLTPVLNALAELPGLDLHVLHLCRRRRRPADLQLDALRYRFSILSHGGLRHESLTWGAGLVRRLAGDRYDVLVLPGADHPSYMQAILHARVTRRRVALWPDGPMPNGRAPGDLRGWIDRQLFGLCHGYLAGGREAAVRLAAHGADSGRIHIVPTALSSADPGARAAVPPRRREVWRRRLGVAAPVVLYVGRLEPRMGVTDLVEAHRGLAGRAELVLVGEGSLGPRLGRWIQTRGWRGLRVVPGTDRERRALWYAAADVFVLPARGGVPAARITDAMVAGLPVVVTDAAAAADLVRPEQNGLVVPARDVAALRGALLRLLEDPPLRMRLAEASRRISAPRTPERTARALAEALRAIHEGPSP